MVTPKAALFKKSFFLLLSYWRLIYYSVIVLKLETISQLLNCLLPIPQNSPGQICHLLLMFTIKREK